MKTTPIHTTEFSKTRATEDIFVFPDICHTDETKTKLNSLDDLMKLLHGNHHVAVVGSAGCGKTTLIGKIGYDWANHGRSSFKYVVILRMKEICGTSGFLEAVHTRLLPTKSEIPKWQLKHHLEKHEKELLIIVDGSCLSSKEFRSSTPHDDWSLKNLLSFKALSKCSLLVTISGHQLEQLQRYSSKYTVVKTDGFSSENIAEYIGKSLGPGQEAQKLTETVRASEIISSLAKSPIMLQVLCRIWKDNKTLPQQIAALFDKAVDVLVQHISCEDGSAWQDFDRLRSSIGEVALTDLLEDQRKRSEFFRDEFPDGRALKFGLEIGVLLEESYSTGENQKSIVKFSRVYYQEYLVACYLVHGSGGETCVREKFLPKVTLETVQKNERLIRFCCGKSGNARSVIIDHLKGLRDSCDQPTQKQWLSNFIKDLCE
ncbi:uncharacterized protein LOC110973866 [Acanthaster planci]|uniref:Uncharacterized protein LOC110973866 n=1 Tax=Acanthaster planci TaxID=133434 RepID=A0A8B7XIW4_ACAPL|nr:uncharacterized protein LOC110973866 [Acanthaster planci]